MAKLMIYGATGYTGGLVCEEAQKAGLDFVLAGRDTTATQQRAKMLGRPHRAFDLSRAGPVDLGLRGISVLLNCAGPFAQTAEPLIDACIRNGVHYLDTSAELVSYHLSEERSLQARAANVTLLPGCGGSIAILGCLLNHLIGKLKRTSVIESACLALHVSGTMSRGSLASAAQGVTGATLQRRAGELVLQDSSGTAVLDFANGQGPVECFPVTLPDLVTMPTFFNIDNVQTFAHASGTAFAEVELDSLPDGPSSEQRATNPYDAVAVVSLEDGSRRSATLHTVNGYTFTAMASVEAVARILHGQVVPGFQTSATLFGADFVHCVPGTTMKYDPTS